MPRPTEAVIDKKALAHNIAVLRNLADGRFLWIVAKADAYGHGLRKLVDVFKAADGLAVLDISEAVDLRRLGWRRDILLIEGFFDFSDLVKIDDLGIQTLIHSRTQIRDLKNYPIENTIGVHVKVNSGMNRLGFQPEEVDEVIAELNTIPKVRVLSVVTHFANSEYETAPDGKVSVETQMSRMKSVQSDVSKCFSNSSAILWHPEAADAMVRGGIAVYGVRSDGQTDSKSLGLIPVMTFRAKIIAEQTIQSGEAVGYGSLFVAQRPSRIGVVACGYADGYPRQKALEQRFVWVNAERIPLVGNVSMDMLTVDLTDYPEVKVGDWVELWGRNISVNEVAAWHNTIGYELLSNLNWRVNRNYQE